MGAVISAAPGNLAVIGVAGDPFVLTLNISAVDGNGNPITPSNFSASLVAITSQGNAQSLIVPTITNPTAGQYVLSWSAAQTALGAPFSTSQTPFGALLGLVWSFSLTISGVGPFALCAGQLTFLPSTTPGSGASTSASIVATVDGGTATVNAVLGGGSSGGGGGTSTGARNVKTVSGIGGVFNFVVPSQLVSPYYDAYYVTLSEPGSTVELPAAYSGMDLIICVAQGGAGGNTYSFTDPGGDSVASGVATTAANQVDQWWVTCEDGASIDVFAMTGSGGGSGGGMANPMTTAGDMIVGGSGGTPQRVGVGANGYVWTSASGVPGWAAATSGGYTAAALTTVSGATLLASTSTTANIYPILLEAGTVETPVNITAPRAPLSQADRLFYQLTQDGTGGRVPALLDHAGGAIVAMDGGAPSWDVVAGNTTLVTAIPNEAGTNWVWTFNAVELAGVIPVSEGGTGATTAAAALANLGGAALAGATFTGDLQAALAPVNSDDVVRLTDLATFSAVIPTTGIPSNTVGQNGDYAADFSAGMVYDKTSGSWAPVPSTVLAPYPGIAANLLATTINGTVGMSNATPTSGVPFLQPVILYAGQVVGHLVYRAASTAAVTPTHSWMALTTAALVQVANTADQLTAPISAYTAYTLAIAATAAGAATSYTVPATGLYYVVFMVAAGTVPNVLGQTSGVVNLAGSTSDTGLTAPPSYPHTYGTLTVGQPLMYFEVAQ